MRTAASSAPGHAPFAAPHRAPLGPIVVATDGADGVRAAAVASGLAARGGAAVHVVSAVELPTPGLPGLGLTPAWRPEVDLVPTLLARRRDRVSALLHEVAGAPSGWPVEVVLDEPSHAIAEAARRHGAALVVVGIGRHDLAARLLGGEVVLRTVQRAAVPVLAVGDELPRLPARVAVAGTDFSAASVKAARAALALLDEGGTLYLVHAWSRTALEVPELAAADDAYERALPDRLARVAAALLDTPRDVTILPLSRQGAPAEALLAVARKHGADLVAAGRRGLGLLTRLLTGRTTTQLLRRSHVAVLVTPEPTPVEREAAERALTGTSESRRPEEWAALLDEFTRRNRGRGATLEEDDPALGAQAQVHGYTLLGASYDRGDGRVALMLGSGRDASRTAHLTRTIPDVQGVAVHADAAGRDVALRLEHGGGQTLLTFATAHAPPSPSAAAP
jgi:nucleotide-binding universal stress UspA family protein